MREGTKRINAYIPDSLYSRVLNSEYNNITDAVIKGLENLLEPPREDFENRAHANTQEGSNYLNDRLLKSLEDRISSLESQIAIKDEQIRNQSIHLQTVLTQKYITPPSKRKEEKPVTKTESRGQNVPLKTSAEKEENEKKALEITCLNCGDIFTAERSTRKFCSGRCKTAYSRRK